MGRGRGSPQRRSDAERRRERKGRNRRHRGTEDGRERKDWRIPVPGGNSIPFRGSGCPPGYFSPGPTVTSPPLVRLLSWRRQRPSPRRRTVSPGGIAPCMGIQSNGSPRQGTARTPARPPGGHPARHPPPSGQWLPSGGPANLGEGARCEDVGRWINSHPRRSRGIPPPSGQWRPPLQGALPPGDPPIRGVGASLSQIFWRLFLKGGGAATRVPPPTDRPSPVPSLCLCASCSALFFVAL